MKFPDLRGLHDKIAKEAGIKEAVVKCSTCGRTEEVDGGKALRHGWSKCCGYTMSLITAEKVD